MTRPHPTKHNLAAVDYELPRKLGIGWDRPTWFTRRYVVGMSRELNVITAFDVDDPAIVV